MAIHLGIDLGGTKIEIIALDGDCVELLRRRVPTPQGNYDATLAAIAQAKPDNLEALQGIAGIGVKKLEAYGQEVLRVVHQA